MNTKESIDRTLVKNAIRMTLQGWMFDNERSRSVSDFIEILDEMKEDYKKAITEGYSDEFQRVVSREIRD